MKYENIGFGLLATLNVAIALVVTYWGVRLLIAATRYVESLV